MGIERDWYQLWKRLSIFFLTLWLAKFHRRRIKERFALGALRLRSAALEEKKGLNHYYLALQSMLKEFFRIPHSDFLPGAGPYGFRLVEPTARRGQRPHFIYFHSTVHLQPS